MKKRLTTEGFIKKAKRIHGDKYDYSLVDYTTSNNKIKIICPTHGIFEQLANNHLSGCECIKCAYINNGIKSRNNKEYFIKKATEIHKNKYDYSLVNYITNKNEVNIICPIHGSFMQRPDLHLQGLECKKCTNRYIVNTEEFINRANKIHLNKYNYSLVNYIKHDTKVEIICEIHGIFKQSPKSHLKGHGCGKCKGVEKLNSETFIRKANIIHNKLYDYSYSNYINSHTKIKIICKIHGYFEQKPYKHLNGQGCPKCKLSKGIKNICNILEQNNISYKKEVSIDGCVSKNNIPLRFDLYLTKLDIYIEYDGEQHFKQVSSWGGTASFLKTLERDNIKNEFCKQHNINLYRISYKDNSEEILKDILNI